MKNIDKLALLLKIDPSDFDLVTASAYLNGAFKAMSGSNAVHKAKETSDTMKAMFRREPGGITVTTDATGPVGIFDIDGSLQIQYFGTLGEYEIEYQRMIHRSPEGIVTLTKPNYAGDLSFLATELDPFVKFAQSGDFKDLPAPLVQQAVNMQLVLEGVLQGNYFPKPAKKKGGHYTCQFIVGA